MANKRTTLTDRQKNELRRELRTKRDEIRARQLYFGDRNDSDFEPDPMDLADAASATTAREEGEALNAHDRWLLNEIESAIARIDEGRYGYSDVSGEPIAYDRLRSIPWARRSADEEEEATRSVQSLR